MRVLERREHLPLDAEAALEIRIGHRAADNLDRHLLLELAVDALGEVDGAHPAPSQLAQDPMAPRRLPKFGSA